MRNFFSLFSTHRRSVIAEEMVIRGDLISRERGPLEIHGRVEGKVVHDGLVIVAATGYCARDIHATFVEIAGEVRGNVEATRRLIIRPSGHLYGNAHCESLVVQQGATFEGTNRPLYTQLPAPAAAARQPERGDGLRAPATPVVEQGPVFEADVRPVERPAEGPLQPQPGPGPAAGRPGEEDGDGREQGPMFHGGITFKG